MLDCARERLIVAEFGEAQIAPLPLARSLSQHKQVVRPGYRCGHRKCASHVPLGHLLIGACRRVSKVRLFPLLTSFGANAHMRGPTKKGPNCCARSIHSQIHTIRSAGRSKVWGRVWLSLSFARALLKIAAPPPPLTARSFPSGRFRSFQLRNIRSLARLRAGASELADELAGAH